MTLLRRLPKMLKIKSLQLFRSLLMLLPNSRTSMLPQLNQSQLKISAVINHAWLLVLDTTAQAYWGLRSVSLSVHAQKLMTWLSSITLEPIQLWIFSRRTTWSQCSRTCRKRSEIINQTFLLNENINFLTTFFCWVKFLEQN